MSHEFETPLGTSIMFLEMLIRDEKLEPQVLQKLKVIFSQLTFLLCLVNCVLDMKSVESGKFQPKIEQFDPLAVLKFIVALFEQNADFQRTKIEYETVKAADLTKAFVFNHKKIRLASKLLPKLLLGD